MCVDSYRFSIATKKMKGNLAVKKHPFNFVLAQNASTCKQFLCNMIGQRSKEMKVPILK
jgi:hypothetical protein